MKVLAVMTERQVLQRDRPQGMVPGGKGGEDGVASYPGARGGRGSLEAAHASQYVL